MPRSKLARKSAAPINIKAGNSFFENFPVVLNLIAKERVTKNVAARIETMVSKALLCDPIEIKVSAHPNPAAAPNASNSGLSGKPFDNSGPLAQKTPTNATAIPTDFNADSEFQLITV
jgi:hypothetical protein